MILAMLLWAGGWSALKIVTYDMSAEVVTFWRFFIMLFVFIPLLKYLKLPIILGMNRAHFKYGLSAALLNTSFMLLAFSALYYGTASGGGVIITTLSPILTYLLVIVIQRHKLEGREKVGLFLGLFGGVVMLGFLTHPQSSFNFATLFYILAAAVWAVLTLVSQKSQPHIHPIYYSFMIAAISSLFMFFVVLIKEESYYAFFTVFEQDYKFWIALLYLGVLAQSMASTIFFIASQKIGSSKASSFMFLVPPFAALIAFVLLKEVVELHVVIGGVLSIMAVYLINKKSKRAS